MVLYWDGWRQRLDVGAVVGGRWDLVGTLCLDRGCWYMFWFSMITGRCLVSGGGHVDVWEDGEGLDTRMLVGRSLIGIERGRWG